MQLLFSLNVSQMTSVGLAVKRNFERTESNACTEIKNGPKSGINGERQLLVNWDCRNIYVGVHQLCDYARYLNLLLTLTARTCLFHLVAVADLWEMAAALAFVWGHVVKTKNMNMREIEKNGGNNRCGIYCKTVRLSESPSRTSITPFWKLSFTLPLSSPTRGYSGPASRTDLRYHNFLSPF